MNIIKRPIFPFAIAVFCFLIISCVILLVHWEKLPPKIITAIEDGSGSPVLSLKNNQVVFILVGFFTILMNLAIADFLFFRERALSVLIAAFSAVFSVFLLIAIGFIVSIN